MNGRRHTLPIDNRTTLLDWMQFAFGAQFVEVRVNARMREIRAPRIVGA